MLNPQIQIGFRAVSVALVMWLAPFTTSATEWGVVSPTEWALGAPADYPETDAVVLRDSSYVALNDDLTSFEAIITRHVRMKALTKHGVDEIGEGSFRFDKNDMIDNLRAHTILPDGTVHQVADEDFFKKEIGDSREMTFAFPNVDSGVVVEFSYDLYGSGYISSWSWQFPKRLYTIASVFSFEVGAGFEYSFATSNMSEADKQPRITQTRRTGRSKSQIYTWEMNNLMPAIEEPYMSSLADYTSRILIQIKTYRGLLYYIDGAEDWKGLGEIFERRVNGYSDSPRGFKKDVRKLIQGSSSDYDKSKVLYDHVSAEYQTSKRLHTLRFDHEKLSNLLKERNGTGAEKNLLLLKMLKEAKVKAWPVLISTRDHGQLPPNNFRTDQFNHLIVFLEVEQGGIYLDASSKYCPYGMLPPLCRTEVGLLVDGGNSELVKIMTSTPTSYRADIARYYLDDHGDAVCSLTSVFTGYFAIEYGRSYESNDPNDFLIEDVLDSPAIEFDLEDYECSLDSLGRFIVNATIKTPHLANSIGDHMSLVPPNFMFATNPFYKERRFYPVDFNYPFTYHSLVQISGDFNAAEVQTPDNIKLSIDGITYTRRSSNTEKGLVKECKLELEKPRFETEEYDRVRSFFNEVSRTGSEPYVFGIGGK